jgi:MAC/Perforin domain
MVDSNDDSSMIPALDVVGRGLFVKPQQIFELRGILFHRYTFKIYPSKETCDTYHLTDGYEVHDSQPMLASVALKQMQIEESRERFEKSTSLDLTAAARNNRFIVDDNASQSSQLRSEEDSYYALRNSFLPLWSIYIPDNQDFSDSDFNLDIPTAYNPSTQLLYALFFKQFETHYIKKIWFSSKAIFAFTVHKSSSMSKNDIKAGIKASLAGAGSAKANASGESTKEKLAKNSERTVFSKGGD